MRKVYLLLGLAAILLLAFGFTHEGGRAIKVGTIQGGISTLDLIPKEELKRLSVDVIHFSRTLDLANALARGDVDLAVIPAELVGKLKEQGEEVYIVDVEMFQNQAIVGRGGSLRAALKGRVGVFVPTGTFSMFKSYMKELYGLNVEELNLVDAPPPQLLEAFSRGEVDAVVIWEPFVSKLIVEMNGTILASYEELWHKWSGSEQPGVMIVWAASKKGMNSPIQGVLEARKEAAKRWGSEYAKARLMEKYGLSEAVAESVLKRVKVWKGGLTDELKENIREVWRLAWEGGYLEKDPSSIWEDVFRAP